MPAVSMTVNGKAVTGEVEARTLLVQFLREQLRLTGTHVGCDTSQCGACVVHVDGIAAKSCTLLTYNVEAQIGGKLAQLGQRLVNGAAKKIADDFFKNFAATVAGPAPEPREGGEQVT